MAMAAKKAALQSSATDGDDRTEGCITAPAPRMAMTAKKAALQLQHHGWR